MRKIGFRLAGGILTVALAGCSIGLSRPVERPTATPMFASPTPPTAVVVTLIPAGTPVRTPAAGEQVSAPTGLPWQDCSLAGGWVGCDPQAPKQAGVAAFTDLNAPAAVALDLSGGQGWSVPVKAEWLAWSPRGDRLLVGIGGDQYLVYDAAGSLVEQLESAARPRWQPDNALGRDGAVHSAEGAEARLDAAPDGSLTLRVKQGAAEQSLPWGAVSPGQVVQLVGWVPESSRVLAQESIAGNAALLQGGRLFTFDTATGARADLELYAPLGDRAALAWRPGAPVLALTALSSAQGETPTLALVDFAGGQVRFPLPEGIEVHSPDWRPSGEQLVFAAIPWEQAPPFERPGLYLLNPLTGAVQALTHPPAGAQDGLPRWTADGAAVLFARRLEGGALEIRAISAAGGEEWLIAAGLSAPCPPEGGCDWQSWAALGAR